MASAGRRCALYVRHGLGDDKLRWDLAVDAGEQAALENLAADCPDARVDYDPAV